MKPRYLADLDAEAFIRAAREIPYQRIQSDLFPGVEVWIRRDDLLDPIISGNKAYKLLFNLIEAREQGADAIITCGGAWSNHIHATAAAGRRFGFKTLGIIRGERPPVLSATLQDAERFGMQLLFISRQAYKQRGEADFLQSLGLNTRHTLYIPEGGANLAGALGARLLGESIAQTAPATFDQIWMACGTGLTLAGAAAGFPQARWVGVPVLKVGESIEREALRWLTELGAAPPGMEILSGHHCGGYAKYPQYLAQVQYRFEQETGIPLDPVYTAKLICALHREIKEGNVAPGSKILLLHSGGLQGRRGY